MKYRLFTLAGFSISLIFWFFDSFVHHYLYGEPEFEIIPNEFNELWMRSTIVVLIAFFGMFADFFIKNIVVRDKQLEVARTYNGMIDASLHILVNLLNQMQLFKVEAQKSKDFDREVIKYYDNAIEEASLLIDKLSVLHDITETNIGTTINPKRYEDLTNNSNPDDS